MDQFRLFFRFSGMLCLLSLISSCDNQSGSSAIKPPGEKKAAPATKTTITEVTSAEAKAKLAANPKIVVIDVRTPEEFAGGHIEGAKNINFNSPDFEKKLRGLDRKTTYLIHCHSGGRSGRAKAVFKELGFEHILHLTHGLGEWEAQGNQVVK